MEQIGERLVWHYVPFTNIPIPLGGLNPLTVFNTVVVMVVLWTAMWLGARSRARAPGRGQVLVELFVGTFDGLVSSSLELETREKNRTYLPLIASLFVFLLLSNFMGFLPTSYFEEPTADVNTTLALGCMAIVIATYSGIKAKGLWGYTAEFFGPLWSQEDAQGAARVLGKLSALFFLPLNVVGELAKVVSISFRLFGNILGGGIIIVVVSNLIYYMLLPIGMDLFFVFFVGTVQAFVFTMLTLTYIAVAIK
ncbi:MAG TPA: F0F1 ATP synthase subunit A [Candidatus Hydrogenedentes bacterium]|nr:F0F1 ATP synthase subunit A [Candidatus Hydrogenedentota bacterium]